MLYDPGDNSRVITPVVRFNPASTDKRLQGPQADGERRFCLIGGN